MPIEKAPRTPRGPLIGSYLGTSSYEAADPRRSALNEIASVWLTIEDSAYYYGEGESLPGPDEGGDGGGAYEATDSTITLNGVYPKVLRPCIVLRGTFDYRLQGDTLTLTQIAGDPPEGRHLIRLIRQ